MFPTWSPSLLLHRRPLSEGRGIPDARTPFGTERIPCDNHIRQMLDGIPPEHFDGVFSAIIADPEVSGTPSGMRCLNGRVPTALDGSRHFRSSKPHCGQCPTRRAGAGRSISTASSACRWSHRANAGPGRWHRSSCVPGTGSASRTAGAVRRGGGRRGSGPPWSGCGRSIRATIPTPALRSGPGRGRQPHLRMQAVEPQDVGRIPAGHGAAGDPPDRGPGFGQTSPPVPVDGRHAPARRRRCAPRHLAGGRDRQTRRQGALPQRLRHRPRRHAR